MINRINKIKSKNPKLRKIFKMKKLLSALLIALLLPTMMLMSACNDASKTSDDKLSFDYTTNFQYYYSNLNGINFPVTKSEKGYYVFLPNNYLYYIDRKSQAATPLCNKPNCSHNSVDCNAYFNLFVNASGESANIVQYYDGNLYIVVKDEDAMGNFLGNILYKVTPDGSTREKLIEFKDGISHWLIHKGYFYFSQDKFADDIDSSSVYDSFSIKRYKINNIKSKPEESGKVTVSTYQEFYSININTIKINQIRNDEGDVCSPFFYNGQLTYLIDNSDTNGKFKYFTSELDGSNPKLLTEMNYGDNLFANESQLYLQNFSEDTDENAATESDGDNVKSLDASFNEKSSFLIPFECSVLNIPQDSDCFIFVQQVDNMNCEIYFVDKSKTESLSGQTVEYKTLLSSVNVEAENNNALSQVDENEKIDTNDNELKNVFENTQNKLYKISTSYDKTLSDEVNSGFSVTLSWAGDGGNYTANFQILKFKTAANAEKFVKENPLSFVNGQYVAFVSVDKIPVEIKDMLVSIIRNEPISPINSTDFGGEIYSFN